MPPWGSHTLSPTRLYTPLHTQERGGVETMKREKKESEKVEDNGRGNERGEPNPSPQAP